MNKSYKTVWNGVLGAWVAVSELARSHGKSGNARTLARLAVAVAVPIVTTLGVGAFLTAAPMAWADGGAGGGGATGGAGFTGANGADDTTGGGGGGAAGAAGGSGGAGGAGLGGTGGAIAGQNGTNGMSGYNTGLGGGGGGGGAHGLASGALANAGALTGGNGGRGGDSSASNWGASLSVAGGGGGGGGYGAVVDGATHTNTGTVTGGNGGDGGAASASLSNTPMGSVSARAGTGGDGGVGVYLSTRGASLVNGTQAIIQGGAGGYSGGGGNLWYDAVSSANVSATAAAGAGGDGVHFAGTGVSLINLGRVIGGASGTTNASATTSGQSVAGYTVSVSATATGEAAGAGVRFEGVNSALDNAATGRIVGGAGGSANAYTNGSLSNSTQTIINVTTQSSSAATGGRGGDGVRFDSGAAVLNNAGAITGGVGGAAYSSANTPAPGGSSVNIAVGGNGGDGVHFSADATVTNSANITGGAAAQSVQAYDSGASYSQGSAPSTNRRDAIGGTGGSGVYLASGSLANGATGIIAGGASTQFLGNYRSSGSALGISSETSVGGAGGAGVTLVAGTLTNAGAIVGGASALYLNAFGSSSSGETLLQDGDTLSRDLTRTATGATGGAGVHVATGRVLNQAGATISGGAANGGLSINGSDDAYLYGNGSTAVSNITVTSKVSIGAVGNQGGAGLVMDGAGSVDNAGLIRGGDAGSYDANGNPTTSVSAYNGSGGAYTNLQNSTLTRTRTRDVTGMGGGAGVEVGAGTLVNAASGSLLGGGVAGVQFNMDDSNYYDSGFDQGNGTSFRSQTTNTTSGGNAGAGAVVSGSGSVTNAGRIAGGHAAVDIGSSNLNIYSGLTNLGSNNSSVNELTSAITGASGGAGVQVRDSGALVSTGTITGGSTANVLRRDASLSVDQSTDPAATGTGNTITSTVTARLAGGAGGAGASLSSSGTLTNSGAITGGSSNDTFDRVYLSATRYNNAPNTSTITLALQGGAGGAGAQLAGGTLTNSGTITGGNGGAVNLAAYDSITGKGVNIQDDIGGALSVSAAAGAGGAGVHFSGGGGVVYNQTGGTLQGGNGATVTHNASGNVPVTVLGAGAGGAGVDGADATVINAGTLQGGLGGDGVRANAVNFTGGVNRLTIEAGSHIIGNVQAFGSADTLGLGGTADASFDAALIGPGAQYRGFGQYEKTGTSTWRLTGTNDLVMPWTVLGGKLAVNGSIANSPVTVASGGTLGGNGTVGRLTAQAGGVVAPGNSIGNLHVNGDYNAAPGSVYQVEYDGTSADQLSVSGIATLSAGAQLQPIHYGTALIPMDHRYTVVTAAGGVSGTYTLGGQTQPTPFITLYDTYDANHVYLQAKQTAPLVPVTPSAPTPTPTPTPATPAVSAAPIIPLGYTPNQAATGRGADSLLANNPVKLALLWQPTLASALGAFDQLSGEIHASLKASAMEDSRFVREASIDRLRGAFCAPGAPGMLTHDKPGQADPCTPDTRRTAWGRVFGSWGHIDGDGNAARLNRSIGGFFVGADMPVGNGWRVGGLAGYSRGSLDVNARSSSATSDNYHLGVYGGNQWGNTGLRLGASYTWQKNDVRRSERFSGFADAQAGTSDAGITQVFGEVGQRIDRGSVAFEPFAGLAYVNVKSSGFAERGGWASLAGAGGTTDVAFSTLGVRASTPLSTSTSLRGMVGWRHAFGGVTASSTHAFAGSAPFTVYGVPLARDVAVLEAGIETQLRPDLTLGATYAGQFGSKRSDNAFKVNLHWKF
jgi:outer membrane autotransporter protein